MTIEVMGSPTAISWFDEGFELGGVGDLEDIAVLAGDPMALQHLRSALTRARVRSSRRSPPTLQLVPVIAVATRHGQQQGAEPAAEQQQRPPRRLRRGHHQSLRSVPVGRRHAPRRWWAVPTGV